MKTLVEQPKRILVVYPQHLRNGMKGENYRFADRLKKFVFIQDGLRFSSCIGGMHLSGLIICEGVKGITHEDLSYFLTRLWTDTPDVMLMGKEQADMLQEISRKLIKENESYGYDTTQIKRCMLSVARRVSVHPKHNDKKDLANIRSIK